MIGSNLNNSLLGGININSEFYRQCLPFARGEVPAELVIRNARVANVFSLEYEKVDVAIARGIVVGLGPAYEGLENVDAAGKVLIPGMIDGHIHIESTMLTPHRFADSVAPRGTSAVMADPHEMANVWGKDGIVAMWKNAQGLPLDFFWGASSCVPASDFETCRQPIGADALAALLDDGTCQHLGEMMNYPAVIGGAADAWAKIAAAWGRPLTAHSPGVSGKDLCAYLLSGCNADHESFSYAEGLEKLRRGCWVMMRAGSAACDLAALAPLVIEKPARSLRCMVVSDDLTPTTIETDGHMDAKMRSMCRLGIDPLVALRMITLSPAEYFMLPRRGGIAPGWIADLALVDSLESCRVEKVWKQGRLVAKGGKLCDEIGGAFPVENLNSRPPVAVESIRVLAPPSKEKIRVIGWQSGSLLTESLCMEPRIESGMVVADPDGDVAKLVVAERNGKSGSVVVGFVSGMGLQFGALGASVAHDAHPFIVAGVDDSSILRALSWLRENGGGFVACEGDRILASLPLPIGGLMSDANLKEVADALNEVDAAAAELGIEGAHPCMALSFLSLSVIPSLKLTDQGYVDLMQGGRQELFVDC
ncbi:MAG TPA: adenine deaminase C-terminal domain-containing protein [Negativicutes bacterium]|nr:adenine deaminase C-terminal domain-containing protein [Negativicutes bacterium]